MNLTPYVLCSEVIDAMFQPSRYDSVYPFSYMYTYFVSVPHSILIQLANPTANKTYGVLPCPALLCPASALVFSALHCWLLISCAI